MPNLSCCVGVAALLFTSVAASLPPSRGPLFTWVCLERCGDNAHDIALQVAQLNANADLFTGVAFELFNLGPRSTLVRNNLTVVAPLLKRLGQRHAMVSSFPYPPEFLTYMREVFAAPQPFIAAVIAALRDPANAITGINVDWEPPSGAGDPKPTIDDALAYAGFLDTLARAVHAAGPFQVTAAVATWSQVWDLKALGATDLDSIATMGTYTGDWLEWQQQLAEARAAIPLAKLVVGLETVNPENGSAPFTLAELTQRFDALASAGISSVGIWRSPVPQDWFPFLRALPSAAAAAPLPAAALLDRTPQLAAPLDVDVLVFGATPSGIAAGIAAANGVRQRHPVLIVEQLEMLGGMAIAGGVGLMNNEQGVYGQGLGGQWCARNARAYNASKPNCFPEMHVGEASFRAMIDETANLTLMLGCRLLAVDRTAACLTTAHFLCADDTQPLTVTARVFVDATYDGDAMVAAGVAHAHGREGRDEYNESLAGIIEHNDPNESFGDLDIDPFWPDGSLLRGISAEPLPPLGSADDSLMAFSYFICGSPLADGRAIPWPRPAAYNASDFELLRRVIARYVERNRTFELTDFTEWQAYATPQNVTKILMCCGRAPVNMDQPELNAGWATATWEQRRAIEAAHRDYLLGSLYFMSNDAAVNNYTRYAIGRWGMCNDEYVATSNFPPQIYVRISNRLKGVKMITQNNINNPQTRSDSIAVGNWDFDQHTESRRVVRDPNDSSRMIVVNEGYMRQSFALPSGGSGNWYDLPFSVMLPQRGDANNLLVSVAISATSVAYSSTRIEQMFVDAGAAAGVAAALAVEAAAGAGGTVGGAAACAGIGPLQDTNVTAVQDVLVRTYAQRIHGPP